MKKRVLVYPCGTEIGLEIYRAVHESIHFELIGGSSTYDHGSFVYQNHIDHLPFITDDSTGNEVAEFNSRIAPYAIDFIYPAMDGVSYKFAEYKDLLSSTLIIPETETVKITRSKAKTYELLRADIEVPSVYHEEDPLIKYPIFMKPDVGQGSKNAKVIYNEQELKYELTKNSNEKMLLLEYLPGAEYTVDCFTNEDGRLIYAGGRTRKRIKSGISVNAVAEVDPEFQRIAEIINSKFNQRGGWFFQLKRNAGGRYSLLEVASRIAGTSSFTRNLGVNLPLLTLHLFNHNKIDSIIKNDYTLELDRALYNKFKSDLQYDCVYLDYDDTLVTEGKVNTRIVAFLYQCINNRIPIILLTKHVGDLEEELITRRLGSIFDEIIHIGSEEEKYQYIKGEKPIFLDDSYGERRKAKDMLGINVFDAHMMECLLEEIG